MKSGFRLGSGHVAAIVIVLAATIGGGIFVIENSNTIGYILRAVVFHKSDSTSFHQRLFADELGLQIFVQTFGIGLGLGSHKANSMVIGLLSNVGVVGFVLLLTFVIGLLRPGSWPNMSRQSVQELRRVIGPFQWFLAGLLLIHAVSAPNLSTMTLWMGIAGLMAIHASLQRTASTAQALEAFRRERSTLLDAAAFSAQRLRRDDAWASD
jgi:hypothetical protein